jgi:multiple sugar transport system substrate-binding protein
MRTISALLLVIGFSLMALAGCKRTDQGDVIHFLMWKPHQPRPLEEAIALFEEENPGVRVERHIGSENASEYYRELTTKLRNADPDLDVFFLDVIWPPEFVARGYLEELGRRLSDAERQAFFPGPMSADTVDGQIWAVPFNIDVGLLFYRKDLLEAYGFSPPATWPEMVRQIDAIIREEGAQNPDLVGYAGQFEKYEGLVCNMLEFIESGGGAFLDGSGRPSVNRPEVIEAIRFVRDELIHNVDHPRRATDYLLTAKEQQSREIFARGDAIFLRNWPETWGILTNPERSIVHDRVGMGPLPSFEGGTRVGTLGGWQLGMGSHSQRKDLAWRFIEHMTSHGIQKKIAIEKAQTMARLSIYDDEELLDALPHFGRSGPWGSSLRDAAMLARPRPRSARYNAVSERIQRALHDAIRRKDSDISGLMAALEDQIEMEMAEATLP